MFLSIFFWAPHNDECSGLPNNSGFGGILNISGFRRCPFAGQFRDGHLPKHALQSHPEACRICQAKGMA